MDLKIDSAAEQNILSALRGGNARQAARLMVAYYGFAVFETCCARVRDRDTAEDLTQATFGRAFASLSELRGGGSTREWLVALAGECCQGYLRDHPDSAGKPAVESAELGISESLRRRLEVLASVV